MNPRETAKKLIAQAVDPGVTKEEARSFAVKAVSFIHEHNLLEVAPAPTVSGLGALLAGLPIERIMQNVNITALGAAGVELIEAKARIQVLERENERLRLIHNTVRTKKRGRRL